MSKFETADRDRLINLLEQKLEMFEQVFGLCEEQTELLEKGEFDKLDGTAGKVQELRDKINGLHQELDALMQSYALLPADGKDDGIEKLILSVAEVIGNCAKLNEKNVNTIKEMAEEQTRKIDEQAAKRKGISGYVQDIPNNPEMFDRKT